MKIGYAYMLASDKNGTIYVGSTSDLIGRRHQHKNHLIEGFSKKYKVVNLVHFEQYEDITTAIERERQLKKWNRRWKIELIEESNPDWKDLSLDF